LKISHIYLFTLARPINETCSSFPCANLDLNNRLHAWGTGILWLIMCEFTTLTNGDVAASAELILVMAFVPLTEQFWSGVVEEVKNEVDVDSTVWLVSVCNRKIWYHFEISVYRELQHNDIALK
jgi:hypothetical protein